MKDLVAKKKAGKMQSIVVTLCLDFFFSKSKREECLVYVRMSQSKGDETFVIEGFEVGTMWDFVF